MLLISPKRIFLALAIYFMFISREKFYNMATFTQNLAMLPEGEETSVFFERDFFTLGHKFFKKGQHSQYFAAVY